MPKKDVFFVLFFSAFLLFLFAGKDFLILAFSRFPHLYSIINVPWLSFEEIYCYLPNFSSVAAFINPDNYLLIMHAVPPLLSFWLIFLIFQRYVAPAWALLLAFWGITFYNNFSVFAFWRTVFFAPEKFIAAASLAPMEITRTPFPSFSFLVFILCFYLSICNYKLSWRHSLLLSAAWAMNAYVYVFNFVAGILFWLPYLVFVAYLKNKKFNLRETAKLLAINLLVVIFIITPFVINLAADFRQHPETLLSLSVYSRSSGFVFSDWGLFFSYLLPLLLLFLVIWLYCADYYELFYKFTPIFLMIGVELIMLNLHMIFGRFIQPQLFSLRIGNFFSRYLYFIPLIYFFSVPRKRFKRGQPQVVIADYVYSFLNGYVIKYKTIIVVFGIVAVGVAAIASNLRCFYNHKINVASEMQQASQKLAQLQAKDPLTGPLITNNIVVDLLLPVLTKNDSLIKSSFTTHLSSDELIERLILYGKVLNWQQDKFLRFMLPGERLDVMSHNVLANGFGYWLVWHLRVMSEAEIIAYRADLIERYQSYNVRKGRENFNPKYVQLR